MSATKMSTTKKRKRREYSAEYKAEVVRLCQPDGGKTPCAVARDLGLPRSAVSRWVDQAKIDAGRGGSGPLTTAEREELSRLRREVKMLRTERDILKKATAFFAREGTS
jgi:transposase